MLKSIVIHFNGALPCSLHKLVAAHGTRLLGCGPRKGRREGEELPEISLQRAVQAEEVRRYVVATDPIQRRAGHAVRGAELSRSSVPRPHLGGFVEGSSDIPTATAERVLSQGGRKGRIPSEI